MATLVHPILPRRFTLGGRTLIGRAGHCTFRIKNRLVSGEHALLTWSVDEGWRLRDLGSRNGTFVDGQSVKPGERVEVRAGCELTFADERWHLSDDAPPMATARLVDGDAVRSASDLLLFLPDDESPKAMIFPDTASEGWVAEIDAEHEPVHDQQILTVGGQQWRLGLPPVAPQSEMTSTLGMDELSLTLSTLERLRFARDGDDLTVEILYRSDVIPVARREHHRLLLTLARAMLDDVGVSRLDKGWRTVDGLCGQLDIDAQQLNGYVFRARRQFASMGVGGAARLIERRAATRQIRLGLDRVELVGALGETSAR